MTGHGIDATDLASVARERREARAELDARVLAVLADRTLDIADTASALRYRYTRNTVRSALERLERKGLLRKVVRMSTDLKSHRRRYWTVAP